MKQQRLYAQQYGVPVRSFLSAWNILSLITAFIDTEQNLVLGLCLYSTTTNFLIHNFW